MNNMKIKIARKVAYSLWEYEMNLKEEHIEYLKSYSISLRKNLNSFLNRKITDKEYITLLNLVSEYGFVDNLNILKEFLIKELNLIAEKDEQLNKLNSEIDD